MSYRAPISLSQALDVLNASVTGLRPQAFHLVFCTANPSAGTGGQRIVFDRAVLTKALNGSAPSSKRKEGQNTSVRTRRYPINVKNLTSNEIRKVHLDLIESVNFHSVL